MPSCRPATDAGLHSTLPSDGRGKRGIVMVDHSPNVLEWEIHPSRQSGSHNRNGHLPNWLGSPLRKPPDGQTMVTQRSSNAHQLPGASGSNSGNSNLCQEEGECPHSLEDGQHVCPDLHQQDGWYGLTRPQSAHGKELWSWCLTKNVTLRASHLPGILNERADEEFMKDRSDWMLCPEIFRTIQAQLGPLEIDLFASRLTKQLPTYVSWRPDPEALETDAFSMNWNGLKAYANPPWNMISRVLGQVRQQEATIVLVAPVWKTQAWYSLLLTLLIQEPLLIPQTKGLIQLTHPINCPSIQPQQVAWRISGQSSLHRAWPAMQCHV